MIRLSTGLRAAMLANAGLRDMMYYGVIHVYTGQQPPSADMAPTGNKIARITEDGTGFTPGQIAGGLRTEMYTLNSLKHLGNWVLTGLDSGQPGWWRFTWNSGDDDSLSLFYPRIDGEVGDSLLNLPAFIGPSTELQNVEFNFYFLSN